MQVDPVSPLIVPFYKFLFGGLAKPSDFDGVRFWMKKPTLASALPSSCVIASPRAYLDTPELPLPISLLHYSSSMTQRTCEPNRNPIA
jgi:hypothetical protein